MTRESNFFERMATVNCVLEIALRTDVNLKSSEPAEEERRDVAAAQTTLDMNSSAKGPNCVFQRKWKLYSRWGKLRTTEFFFKS